MPTKIDYKKQHKIYYQPPTDQPEIVEVPSFQYLMIDGIGLDFNDQFCQDAIQALFGVSYKVKFTIKKDQGIDYVVMPLEGLWWADDFNDFINGNKAKWKWTYMILQPEFVTLDLIQTAIMDAKKSKPNQALELLRLETYQEGLAAQLMHIGPFSEEHENIMKIHHLIEERGGKFDGIRQKHHEIYLSDFRKTAPEKLKTVLRQPFNK